MPSDAKRQKDTFIKPVFGNFSGDLVAGFSNHSISCCFVFLELFAIFAIEVQPEETFAIAAAAISATKQQK